MASPADRGRVRALYDDYVHLLNSGDLEQWLELFAEDCSYRVISRENHAQGLPLALVRCDSRAMLADRIAAIRNTQFFVPRILRYFVSGVRVGATEPAGPPVTAQSLVVGLAVTAQFLVVESLEHEAPRIHSVGEYRDRVVEREGELCFASKCAIYDPPVIATSLIGPL